LLAASRGADGGVYNIAGPEDVRLSDVLRELSRLLGRPVPAWRAAAGRGDPRVATVSIARARRELGYAPNIRLREGLARQLAAAGRDVDALARVADA
jgi:nucleoside-diphosphate-sugar epimerase